MLGNKKLGQEQSRTRRKTRSWNSWEKRSHSNSKKWHDELYNDLRGEAEKKEEKQPEHHYDPS